MGKDFLCDKIIAEGAVGAMQFVEEGSEVLVAWLTFTDHKWRVCVYTFKTVNKHFNISSRLSCRKLFHGLMFQLPDLITINALIC